MLKEYHGGDNPFYAKSLFRNKREEQDAVVRRQAFTKEEEQRLLEELRFPAHKLMNKEEIRIIYTMILFQHGKWCTRRDLNSRPSTPEADALSN